MMGITRRDFLKATAATVATAAIGRSVIGKNTGPNDFSLTEQFDLIETALAEEAVRDVTIVSDVDGHSQCMMRVSVEDGVVTQISSNPRDPEGAGELTMRGKHTKEILYAPDRLQYPMKRAGERGEGEWERISWDEALATIADRLGEIRNEYGAEAIDFPWKTREEAIDYELAPLGITCAKLRAHPEGMTITTPPLMYKKFSGFFGGIVRSILKVTKFKDYPEMYKKYDSFSGGFLTPSKKVNLYSKRLEELGYDPLPVYREPAESPISQPDLAREYPLVLVTGVKLEMYTHSMMRNIPGLYERFPENLLEINPETVAGLGIGDGDVAGVESPRGRVECKAYVTDQIDPRVVCLYHGFAECNCNVLTDNGAIDPITGSTGLKSLLCRVEKV